MSVGFRKRDSAAQPAAAPTQFATSCVPLPSRRKPITLLLPSTPDAT
jgi:hypothetical protein